MLRTGRSPAISFYVRGSDDEDSLLIVTEGFEGRLALDIPTRALPWRDLRMIEKWGRRREPYGCCEMDDPLDTVRVHAKGPEVEERAGIRGADEIAMVGGIATVTFTTAKPVFIPCVRIAVGAAMQTAVRVATLRRAGEDAAVHVAQLSGGRRVGGVTLAIGGGQQGRR
jgi:hypothetical protein